MTPSKGFGGGSAFVGQGQLTLATNLLPCLLDSHSVFLFTLRPSSTLVSPRHDPALAYNHLALLSSLKEFNIRVSNMIVELLCLHNT